MSILQILALAFAVSMTMIRPATAQTSPGAIQPNTFPEIFPGPQLSPLSYCAPASLAFVERQILICRVAAQLNPVYFPNYLRIRLIDRIHPVAKPLRARSVVWAGMRSGCCANEAS